MATRVALAGWALVLSPAIGLAIGVGLHVLYLGAAAIVLAFVVSALLTLTVALRAKRSGWVLVLAPVLSGLLVIAYGFLFLIVLSEGGSFA